MTECSDGLMPRACPQCGSTKMTYIIGELKERKRTFGRRTETSQVTFKEEGRMEKLDRKYGKRY